MRIVEEQLDGDEELLKRIVHAKGPVIAAIYITQELMLYAGGVYKDDTAPKDEVNHAVVRKVICKIFSLQLSMFYRSSVDMAKIQSTVLTGRLEILG